MIKRAQSLKEISRLLSRNRVVAILGARQVGKTTLARQVLSVKDGGHTYFDLEDSRDLAALEEPMLTLGRLKGLVVLDEIQRRPDLFHALRVLVDRKRSPLRFLILGSASPELLRQTSETLAGRIHYTELGGFHLDEVGRNKEGRLWLRGGFPRSFLASSDRASDEWRRGFVQTFLERDVPQLGIRIPARTLERFWAMLAHYHGQIWNSSVFAGSFGVADTTIRRYVDLLTGTYLVRQLLPWHENLKKRQVKAPKFYIADTGLLHTLLGVATRRELERHPKVGASWEGFALGEVVRVLGARPEECFFWATHAGAELDLLVVRGRRRLGFEFKRTETPKVTPSMRNAIKDLGLFRLDVIHAGTRTFPLSKKIRAVAFSRLRSDVRSLR